MQACSGTCKNSRVTVTNSFHAIDLFPYPLKTSENQRFFMFSGCIESAQKEQKTLNLHKMKMFATHQLFCWLYYTFFWLLMYHRIRVSKKKRSVQLCATDCNWLQLIAIATVCNWFKYKCFQIVKQFEFLFSWGIKSALHSFMFIYLSLLFSLYKYLYAHIFICKHPFTFWWFHGNWCTWANDVPKCTGYHKTVMEGMWQYPFILNCRGSNKMHQEEN